MATVSNIDVAVERLQSGAPVAIPTETVYGLAAPISNTDAINAVFRIKARPFFDPLIVHVASRDQASAVVAEFPPLAEKLAKKFWPGPLTLVLPRRQDLNPRITSGLETVGVRLPDHDLTRKLLERVGPLAAPSANRFGRTSPTTAEHVRNEFGSEVFVLDGGACRVGLESTVIGFSKDYSTIHIYRPGAITQAMLEEFAPTSVTRSPAAPGQLEHHYMPAIPLVILARGPHLTEEIYEDLTTRFAVTALYPSWMRLPEDPRLAARSLYAELRNAGEKPGRNCILLSFDLGAVEPDGLQAALKDRLEKAAAYIAY